MFCLGWCIEQRRKKEFIWLEPRRLKLNTVATGTITTMFHTGNHYRSRRKMIKYARRKGKPLSNYGLYQAKASGDLSAYDAIEAAWFKHWNIERTGKVSPMAEFDESHAKWVKNGREC